MNKKATIFEFTSYKFEPDKNRIFFNYKTEFEEQKPLFFKETIILPEVVKINDIPKNTLNKLLQSLHIILGISYYKSYCAPVIKFSNMDMVISKKEADFWNTLYKKGLGEFFYKNNLDPKISPKFPFSQNSEHQPLNLEKYGRSLLGIGGGKDSIVAAELLKNNFDITGFIVETNHNSELIDNVVKKIGINILKIERILDRKVYEEHQYNGHIPISAIYAFLGVLTAILYKYDSFIVGNEYSSNFGNLKYKKEIINHQWSKSFEFEKLFQEFLNSFITPNISYFSLLRPFYEIRIVKTFVKYKKYFSNFSSCNRNFSHTRNLSGGLWCGECPKCVFVFTLLSAYLTKSEVIKIFGKNLYTNKNLLSLFADVLGFGKMKPFDCVGTFEEAQTALFLAKKEFGNDFIVKQFIKNVKYDSELLSVQKESKIPEQFRFLGMENALILGYGMEGKVTQKYLKKYYPKLKIGIADEALDKNYLDVQEEYDIAVKTPFMKKRLVSIPYTTATNIFFSHVKGKNMTIGVTGSKGKSTTASLIYEILKTAKMDVVLLGNIGRPMLEALMNPIPKDRIFVLELSSYQLDDIKFSPDIAVVTNLFPEHMDYHGGLKNYYEAKRNIINFQNEKEYFVYNPENKIMSDWLKNYKGSGITFNSSNLESNILGDHNKNNIGAAITVAELLEIDDVAIKRAVKNFKGLPHRLEFVGKFKGINFYNDGSSTNPESTILAIKSIRNIDTILLGGEDRGYDFRELEKIIKKYKIRNIVLFPDSGRKIIKNKKDYNILYTDKMKEAVDFAFKNTNSGGVCLLSCASPSYSLWENFEEKGDQFKKFVKTLNNKIR